MNLVELDTAPTDPSAWTTHHWADASTVTVKPRLDRWACARRTALRLRAALTRLGVRAVSAPLRLSWRLDLTIGVDADVVAPDPDSARTALARFLRDSATRVVVYAPDHCPTGWRPLAATPVEHVGAIVAEPDDLDDPPALWSVRTVVTASVTVPARDADIIDCFADIAPFTTPAPIRHVICANDRIRRTPVRRRPSR